MTSLLCGTTSEAGNRYVVRMLEAAGLCILFSVVAAFSFRFGHLKGLLAYPIAGLPALPIVWALIETGRYLADEKDEFQRNLLVQCLLGGIGGTLAITTVWGYLEDFVHVPRLDLTLVYPIFWFCVALTMPIVKAKYR
jgi:hypothetical protein